ncbi:tripartite tricarboxylate transporter permease [Actinophytocola sediminis]
MDALEGLAYGFEVAITPENLFAAFIGVLIGTMIGVIPGLGPVAGAALILPFTYTLNPAAAVIMIAGIYYGGMYGGSTTSVLLNVPGETASVVTTIDGYQLTKKGRAGPTLFIMAVGSLIAATVSITLVAAFTPTLAGIGLDFGPAEFFAVMVCGLVMLSRISGGSLLSSLFPLAIGLAVGTVGQEQVTSVYRFTFGSLDLASGLPVVAIAIGLYGIAEVFSLLEDRGKAPTVSRVRVRDMVPSREEWRRSWAPWGRGSVIGFLFGLLPGPSAAMSSFASYRAEQKLSKYRKELGHGAIEGVAGPEAANNAAATSGMVPVLSLGLPFSATLALILSALMIQGIQPGPLLVDQHPDIFWGVIASMYIGNIMLLVLNIPLIGVWVSMLRIPLYVLAVAILLVATVGAFSATNSMLGAYALVVAGIVGYFLRKLAFNLTPLILGLILGPLIEKHLREGLFLSQGDLGYFVSGPIAPVIYAAMLVVVVLVPIHRMRRRARHRAASAPTS